jgi:hypothetical protein
MACYVSFHVSEQLDEFDQWLAEVEAKGDQVGCDKMSVVEHRKTLVNKVKKTEGRGK